MKIDVQRGLCNLTSFKKLLYFLQQSEYTSGLCTFELLVVLDECDDSDFKTVPWDLQRTMLRSKVHTQKLSPLLLGDSPVPIATMWHFCHALGEHY